VFCAMVLYPDPGRSKQIRRVLAWPFAGKGDRMRSGSRSRVLKDTDDDKLVRRGGSTDDLPPCWVSVLESRLIEV
jgi:hypothetical protein